MTYREEIQSLQNDIDAIYTKSARLRDAAIEQEKAHWNELRKNLGKCNDLLCSLDNSLDQARALMQLFK